MSGAGVLTPSELGLPCTRARRFTICLKKTLVTSMPRLSHPVQEAKRVFYAEVIANGDIYWRAPKAQLDAILARSGAATWLDMLGVGDRARLKEALGLGGVASGTPEQGG